MLPLEDGICSEPSPRRHGWQEEQFLGSLSAWLWCWNAQGGSRGQPGLRWEGGGRRAGALFCSRRHKLCGRAEAPKLFPWAVVGARPGPPSSLEGICWTGVQQLKEQPEAPSYRSCPTPTFPSIRDTPLPFRGVSWVVSLCLREPGRVSTASSSTQLWALQLWGFPCSVGTSSRFGSCGRFFSAAWPAFALPGCAQTQCWALGSLPCLARGGGPVLPRFWLLQGQQEP